MKSIALHWKILIGMLLGVTFGFIMLEVQGGAGFVANWIKPLGTIFVKLLKLNKKIISVTIKKNNFIADFLI